MKMSNQNPTHACRLAATVCAAAGFLCASGLATAQTARTEAKGSGGELRVVSTEPFGDDQVKSEALEIRIENGKVSVKRNGKEVPDAQIKQEDGRVIILDENGNEIEGMKFFGGGGASRGFSFADTTWAPFPKGHLFSGEAGPAPKVMLGVHMAPTHPALEYHFKLERGATTMLSGVFEGLPAHEAGLGEHDIIVEIEGAGPADSETIRKTVADKDAGDEITFTVIHEGRQKDVKIKLQAYDAKMMEGSKLLGKGPGQMYLAGKLLPHGFQEFDVEVPGEMPQFYTFPKDMDGEKWQMIVPQFQEWRRGLSAPGTEGQNLDERLKRLDERMEQLEKMLEKLVEKRTQ